ncbi:hypothetical protein AGABI1DRAFT_76766 [Agaricus bisporus var. burnettii JB137-S8]|uniref:Sucraseferredoxin-like protein n=1 Tax=Agaricus bisporus var. burnettii (strain JB137-S8 / ATCC MYA-4627 / FGSC 10392) TaxID=597362 RepID=K5X4B6_AGABU|nr:uncharacterized protein AGABI1DRAFT_76766 [Agaricus bisporus var. burnettii JB137-S8]EKM77772.1 hypothetical protein AGABI1DRAFT_76766 [Agaricus bisporus var. burnettii JB137-S8]
MNAAVRLARGLATDATKPLYGTVPPHSSYLFLRSNEPPSAFPVKIFTQLQRELLLRTFKLGIIVNWAWTGEPHDLPEGETSATMFSTKGGRLEIPRIALENMDDVGARVKAHIEKKTAEPGTDEQIHLYICTHGARDCRCGEHGGEFARALKEETERRSLGHRVKVREVGHVGGHRYASNLLVYPHGEWLGQLRSEDAPHVLDEILALPVRPFTLKDPPPAPSHWRGRTGLGKDEQIDLFESHFHKTS